eukprot:6140473-Amphidinium_carterae.1
MSSVEANLPGSVVNSGLDARDTAWQKLVEQYEPQQRTRFAGQLQTLLSWKFAGDIEGRMEAFEREILRYEHASGEGVSDALRVGVAMHVLRQLEETKLKEYLLMNASKLTVWKDFKAEVNTIKRTQANRTFTYGSRRVHQR